MLLRKTDTLKIAIGTLNRCYGDTNFTIRIKPGYTAVTSSDERRKQQEHDFSRQ
jgi:hypothetical protein